MASAIIAGSAIGDLIVATVFFVVTDVFGGAIASLQVLKNPLFQGPILILGGIALLFIVSRSVLLGLPQQEQTRDEQWTYMGAGLAALIALSASVSHLAGGVLDRDRAHLVQHDRIALPSGRKAGTPNHATRDAEFVRAVHRGRIRPTRSCGEPPRHLSAAVSAAMPFNPR
jgi:hypothetical protein